MKRKNYYSELIADYSKIGLVSSELQKELIKKSAEIGCLQEGKLPDINSEYTLEMIEAEIKNFGQLIVKLLDKAEEIYLLKNIDLI